MKNILFFILLTIFSLVLNACSSTDRKEQQVLDDDKAQVVEVEATLQAIDLPVKSLNERIDSTMDNLCPDTSDMLCLKKHSKLLSSLFDSAYEENLRAVNRCYNLTQEVKHKKISDGTKSQLIAAIDALSLRYGYFEDAANFAQEAFDQLESNNIKEFSKNMDQFAARTASVKSEYAKAMGVLSELNANLGIRPTQK